MCEEARAFFSNGQRSGEALGRRDDEDLRSIKQLQERIEGIPYEGVEKIGGIFADPDYGVERVQALQEEFQVTEFIY